MELAWITSAASMNCSIIRASRCSRTKRILALSFRLSGTGFPNINWLAFLQNKHPRMKILIVEDEDLAVKKLKKTLFSVDDTATVVGEADSIKSTVNWLQNNPSPDLILMD